MLIIAMRSRGEYSLLLPKHQQKSDVPTSKPDAAGEVMIVYVDPCSTAAKMMIASSLAVLAIFSLAMAFTANSFLPPMPSVTLDSVSLDSVSGSAFQPVPDSPNLYAVEDFTATFSIRNYAKEGMIYTHYRVYAVEVYGEADNRAGRFGKTGFTMFESEELEPRVFEKGGSLTVQLAVPNMTIKVSNWVFKDINDPVSAVGVSTLRLYLESRARYRGKAWPEQVTLCSSCENIVARLLPVQNATRRVELEYKYDDRKGKDCSTSGPWFYLKLLIVFYLIVLAFSIPLALCSTFSCVMSKNNK